jgi:metal-sulfur cluster biosynthetic enzyme
VTESHPDIPSDVADPLEHVADRAADAATEPLPDAGVGPLPAEAAGAASTDALTVEVDDVFEALANVIDPELGLDFVELGLVYGVEVNNEGDVHITFTLTTPACPIGPQVTEQMEEFVGELEGVKSVECEMVFVPPWSPERMSEDAKFALGF